MLLRLLNIDVQTHISSKPQISSLRTRSQSKRLYLWNTICWKNYQCKSFIGIFMDQKFQNYLYYWLNLLMELVFLQNSWLDFFTHGPNLKLSPLFVSFSIKKSIDSFVFELDYSFPNIMKKFLNVGIGVLIDQKWQKYSSF